MPDCNYCNQPAELVTGADIYPHRKDLASKRFWRCSPCAAWVGCHPGTDKPLGRLANAELRTAKQAAHAAFDPIWRSGDVHRGVAYRSLAKKLGLSIEQCHIGMFDIAMCRRVVEVCKEQR